MIDGVFGQADHILELLLVAVAVAMCRGRIVRLGRVAGWSSCGQLFGQIVAGSGSLELGTKKPPTRCRVGGLLFRPSF